MENKYIGYNHSKSVILFSMKPHVPNNFTYLRHMTCMGDYGSGNAAGKEYGHETQLRTMPPHQWSSTCVCSLSLDEPMCLPERNALCLMVFISNHQFAEVPLHLFLSCVTLIRRTSEVWWTYLAPQRSCRYRKEHCVGSLITTNLTRNVLEYLSICYRIDGAITMLNRITNNFLTKLLNH